MSEHSKYQELRAHLAFLRMTAAAEALPAELDHAIQAKLSHQDFLERLLAREVTAVDEPACPASPRCPPRSPWPTSTSPPSRRWTRS
jgi:hypothetical protein